MQAALVMQTPEPMPSVLLPYQQRWVADDSPVKVAEKSRRTGFTWATACEAVLVAGDRAGMDVWYLGYDQDLAREFIGDVGEWAAKLNTVGRVLSFNGVTDETTIEEFHIIAATGAEISTAQHERRVQDGLADAESDILSYRVALGSGHRVSALTSSPRKFRGRQGYAIIDEAAYHDRLPELLKAAMAFLMWGGRIAIISTHNGVDNHFNKLCEDIRGGRKNWSLHRVTLDDAIREGLYQRICLVRGLEWTPANENGWREDLIRDYGDGADEELHCIPANTGRKYMSGTLIESRMIAAPVIRREFDDDWAQKPEAERVQDMERWCDLMLKPLLDALPKELPHAFGEDFGRTADLTVFGPVTTCQNMVRRFPFLVELRNCPHEAQAQAMIYVIRRLPHFGKGWLDAGGNGSYVAEKVWQEFGSSIERVHIDRDWYATNLPIFKAGCEDALIEYPRDVDVKSDLMSFELVDGLPRLPSTRAKGKNGPRHGDAGIMLVMGYAASRDDSAEQWLAAYGNRKGR